MIHKTRLINMVILRVIIGIMVLYGLNASEIYVFIDGKSDGSAWRTLVSVDNKPWLFIDKIGTSETTVNRDECGKYRFVIKVDGDIIRGITYTDGIGEVVFADNGKDIPFSDKIPKLSWSHSATGIGPWPVAYVFILNDIRLAPRNSVESLAIISEYAELVQRNSIKDNRKSD